MGAVLGSAMKSTMDENFKKNQEFMLQTQKLQVQSLWVQLTASVLLFFLWECLYCFKKMFFLIIDQNLSWSV